jgi:lambda family phage tail tape measure protein
MAANIKIALELDDRGYVQGLKSSVDQTKNLAKETEKLGNSGGASFGKMNTSLMAVGNNIKGLIAGYVGLQSVMASFRMADDINDLASATSVSIASIMQLRGALAEAGGSADDAGKLISNLSNTIFEAQQGSSQAQDKLRQLGFSLKEMGSLTPEAALNKTISALANIQNPIERNALAFQILGKSARNIDWDDVNNKVSKGNEEFKKYEESIKAAGVTMDLISNLGKVMAVSLVVAAQPIGDLVKYLLKLAENSKAVSLVFEGLKIAFQTVAVLAANIVFVIETMISDMIALVEASGKFLKMDWAGGLAVFKERAKVSEENRKALDELQKKILGTSDATKENTKATDENNKASVNVLDAYKKQKDAIIEVYDAYAKGNKRAQEKLESDYALIGASTEQKKTYEEITRIYNGAADAIEKLRQKQEQLNPDERRAGMGKVIDDQIKKIEEQRDADMKSAAETISSNEEVQRQFSTGWEGAFKKYADDANNAAMQAQSIFQTMAKGMESALQQFILTGKLDFKGFANAIIAELARIQAAQIAAGLMKYITQGIQWFGASNGSNAPAGKAVGGPVVPGTPYVVGENGPEMFMPNSGGMIMRNDQMGQMGGLNNTNVTYNIQAVDASSFRNLLSQDPELIFSLTEKGRARMSGGRI